MKIVLAVDEDKQTIVKRTGQSAYFAIYEDATLIDLVPNVSTKLTPSSKVNNIFYSSKISLTFQGNNSSISLFSA